MDTIERIEIIQVDLPPKVVRTDAIQAFVKQETPIVRITCDDGATGTGYSYTIGTGGSSVVALLRDHLAPLLIGEDPIDVERLWAKMWVPKLVGRRGITTRAISALDIGLWDLRAKVAGLPLYKLLGGYRSELSDVNAGIVHACADQGIWGGVHGRGLRQHHVDSVL